jgi:hypothetical protein
MRPFHRPSLRTGILILVASLVGEAVGGARVNAPGDTTADLAELWVEPETERDLYHGPGGRAMAPDPAVRYQVVSVKIGGFSEGYDVRDPSGREWSAKFPPEASPEVVASRLHWGLGFHQPPIYLLREWHADGASAPNPQLPARFREEEPDFHGLEEQDSWAYGDNPFQGTRALTGLLVLQVMLANSDLKPSNNSIYTLDEPLEGAGRWYVARDIGHTFGRTGVFESPRGDVEAYESTGFIREVEGTRVLLDYAGRHSELFTEVTVDDVRWICERLARLTEQQWQDAFRAGGYEPGMAARFIRKLKSKVSDGLALPAAPSASSPTSGARAVPADRADNRERQS